MDNRPEPGWLAAIPANIRYNQTLKPNAKLLYAEISALCKKEGYCWADNEYFAELYGVTTRTISSLISQLEELSFIQIELLSHGNNQGKQQRRIYIDIDVLEVLRSGRNFPALRKKFSSAAEEIFQSNNIILNNIIYPPKVPQGDGERKRRKEQPEPDWLPERFDRFWNYYKTLVPKGKRIGTRDAARKAWNRLKPDDATLHDMATALAEQSTTDDWHRGIGISYVSSWLNGRKWESESGDMAGECEAAPAGEERMGWD